MELLQRWILVHSYLYYIMDVSIVSDHMYDMNSKQLAEFKTEYPEDWSRARYTYAMNDFDGSTGFGFVEKLEDRERRSVVWDVGRLTTRHVVRKVR